MKIISCLIDFSETAKTATIYAVWLAKKYNASINLIHFVSNVEDQKAIEERLVSHSGIASAKVAFTCTIGGGNYLKKIPEMVKHSHTDLVVIGSHGTQSSSEILSTGNVVKLVQRIPVPALVINQHSTVPVPPIQEILFPMAPHNNFAIKIEESARWAKLHNAHIDILCLISDEDALPPDISINLEKSLNSFSQENIEHTKTLKESKVYSVGYAKDILRYTEEKHFDLIAIMSQNSEENSYFGSVEKTNLLLNPLGIPILCVNR